MATTEVLMINGDRYEVAGEASDIEAVIVGAARGSIMALAWLTEARSGSEVALDPDHVIALRTGLSG